MNAATSRNLDRVLKELGKGTFGAVFKCSDMKHDDHVAVKVIRSIQRYIDSAKIEASILDDIYDKQKNRGVNLCVKMYSHFKFDGKFARPSSTFNVCPYLFT